MEPTPAGVAVTSAFPDLSWSPSDGELSTVQSVSETSTTSVNSEPAAPSTSPCDAFRLATSHTPIPATGVGVGMTVATGGGVAAIVAAGAAVAGSRASGTGLAGCTGGPQP